jgi:hypothetical protein
VNIKFYKTEKKRFAGTSYGEVYTKAKFIYKTYSSKTKRRPYIRSRFFKKEKIFLDLFWIHLSEKNQGDRLRRLRLYACGIDLIKNSRIVPLSQRNTERPSEILHRFYGVDFDGEQFIVQIKEHIKTREKNFMSVLPLH